MARFYFDLHDANGITRDDDGEELPSAIIAQHVALETIGHTVKDLTYRHDGARVVIEVRDGDGPVLRVSAVVETTSLKDWRPSLVKDLCAVFTEPLKKTSAARS